MTEPRFMSERGYFYDNPHAAQDAPNVGAMRKNVDFLRLKDEALFLLDPVPGMRVLEMGCASGAGLVYCALQGASVTGVDLAESSVEGANTKLSHLGVDGRALVGDAADTGLDDASFDAVLSSDFHEHIDAATQVAVLREAWRVLKPGGRLVVKTPNVAYLHAALWYKRIGALLRGRSPRGFVIPHSPGTHDPQHIGLITRPELASQLEAAGFVHYRFHYAPLRRFGRRATVDVLSTAVPLVRDVLSEDLLVVARKPIALAHFPD